jgi:hypothetical protein
MKAIDMMYEGRFRKFGKQTVSIAFHFSMIAFAPFGLDHGS